MTDADVDGSHIRALLLTFNNHPFNKLIEKGIFILLNQCYLKLIKDQKESNSDENELEKYILENSKMAKILKKVQENTKIFANQKNQN